MNTIIPNKEAIDFLEKDLEYMRYHCKDELVETCERALEALKFKQLLEERDRLKKVLDEIREEVSTMGRKFDTWNYDMVEVSKVIEVIDKHRREEE